MVFLLGAVFFALPLIFALIFIFIFWIIMFVDTITRKFKGENDKLLWVLVILFASLLGSLIYYFIVFKKDKNKSIKWLWWTILILVAIFILGLITSIANLL